MSDNKKKAAAIAAVKTMVDANTTEQQLIRPTEPTAWTQWAKQTIMMNRNLAQMRLNKKK